jgi:preprotein translocase subunit SecD
MMRRYQIWNCILIVTLLVGCLYSLPNFFPEKPVVQISSEKNPTLLQNEVKRILSTLPDVSVRQENTQNGVLLHCLNPDTQSNLKDRLTSVLGEDVVITENRLPTIPGWLKKIGAIPMRLGLDLRGGIHFTLELDIDSLLVQRTQGLRKNIAGFLTQEKLRYTFVAIQTSTIVINFPDREALNLAKPKLIRQFQELNFSTDAQGTTIQGTWTQQSLNTLHQHAIEQTINTLANRINELGISEPIIQQQGNNHIVVDMPGVQDSTRAEQILGGTASIEFHLVAPQDAQSAANTGVIPLGTRLYTYADRPVLLQDQVALSGSSITDASAGFDEMGRPDVMIRLGGGGENYFYRLTKANIGKPLAIVYTETKMIKVNDTRIPKKTERVINIATIQSALANNFQVTGLTSNKEATDLALWLRSGSLPAPIYVVEQRTIGPQLGAENIRMGVISILVGFGLAIIFMAIYYRFFGIIANFGLFVNLILLIALLSRLGMTLTLPGMAGIVLMLGMSVDANVLIFERIREELRKGSSVQMSIATGYKQAISTIVDANITTLIAAVVLFEIGTGPIKGFSVTLGIGLLTSMITGILFTRSLIHTFYGKRRLKKISIGI